MAEHSVVKTLLWALAGAALIALTGCGSSSDSSGGTIVPAGSGTLDPPSVGPAQQLSVTVSEPEVQIGNATTVKANVKNTSGKPVAGANVVFQSSDTSKVRLNPPVGTAVTDQNGDATIAIEALAVGQVNITATVDVNGARQTGAVVVGVGGSESRNILFVSVTKNTLTIAGTGGPATSELVFKVQNQLGAPIAGALVNFAPSVTTGGLSVSPLSAVSQGDGTVRTTVTAGTVPTPVRVTASVTIGNATTSVQSSLLSISSGLPSQAFFSAAPETLNVDGCDFNGTKTPISAFVGDQFGNPVPDGTTVNFITEGGRIGAGGAGSCSVVNGGCKVDLETQDFRPHDCRVTVLAYATGQEAFVDTNSNGVHDNGESFEDLSDAFLKVQPRAVTGGLGTSSPVFAPNFDASTGVIVSDTFSAAPNPLDPREADRLLRFTDSGQSAPVADSVWGLAHVRRSFEVVFSARGGSMVVESPLGSFAGCGQAVQSTQMLVRLVDRNGNPFAYGSKIAADATGGTVTKVFPDTVLNTTRHGGTFHTIVVTSDPARCTGGSSVGQPGNLIVTVTPVGSGGFIRSFPIQY